MRYSATRSETTKQDLQKDDRDSAPFAPKSVVIEPHFEWEGDRRLSIPWEETIIYELHTRGMTKLMTALPENIRGTYAGLAHPPRSNI